MKNILLIVLIALLGNSLSAQTKEQKILKALNDYIEGTSYSRIDQIHEAFHPEADLFLDDRNSDSIKIIDNRDYAQFFTKKPGAFTGRIGDILQMDYFGNIAMAKAEILIPKAKLRFVDMFILKKSLGTWRIISKTANSETSNKAGKKVLFVVSNATYYDESDIPTGNSFSEIVQAYNVFDTSGFIIDFVSPSGGALSLAYINSSDSLYRKYLYDADFMYRLGHTKKPSDLKADQYSAVYYVGGGAAMFDVPVNESIQTLVMDIYEKHNGIISSVCHGTAGITHLKTSDGQFLVNGKTINGYPDDFENSEAPYFKTFPFLIKETIESHGGKFVFGERNKPFVQVDGRIVTGQNHLSANLVALKIVSLLDKID